MLTGLKENSDWTLLSSNLKEGKTILCGKNMGFIHQYLALSYKPSTTRGGTVLNI